MGYYYDIDLDDIHAEVEQTLTELMFKLIREYHDTDLVLREMHYAIHRWEHANIAR